MFILLYSCVFAPSHSMDQKFEQVASFSDDVLVINCTNSSPYLPEVFEEALDFFKNNEKNYIISVSTDCEELCMATKNTILVTGPECYYKENKRSKNIAVTIKETSYFGSIYNARIESADPRYLTLKHELGHAFGWSHSLEEGHLMFPVLDKIKDNTRGMYD